MTKQTTTKKSTLIKLESIRKGALQYHFDNGNWVSVIFGPYSYSELKEMDRETRENPEVVYTSRDMEVMVEGPMLKWFERKYECNPAGYLPVDELFNILAFARRQKAKGDITASGRHQDE